MPTIAVDPQQIQMEPAELTIKSFMMTSNWKKNLVPMVYATMFQRFNG